MSEVPEVPVKRHQTKNTELKFQPHLDSPELDKLVSRVEVKNLPASAGNVRDVGLIPGWGRSPGGRNGTPLQYSCLEVSMDRGAWWATVHGAAKIQTRRSTQHTPIDCLICELILISPFQFTNQALILHSAQFTLSSEIQDGIKQYKMLFNQKRSKIP